MMNRRIDRLDSWISSDKISLENRLLEISRDLDGNFQPNEITQVYANIPLADNYSSPSRSAIFGDGYDELDIQMRLNKSPNYEDWVEGARFTFKRNNRPEFTVIELMDHRPNEILSEVPFCIIPSGALEPVSETNLEELVFFIDDIAQHRQYDSKSLFDPRERQVPNLAQALQYLIGGIGKSASEHVEQKIYKYSQPLVSSIAGQAYIQERTMSLNLQKHCGKPKSAAFYIDADITDVIRQRLSIIYSHNKGCSQVLSVLRGEGDEIQTANSRYSNAEEADAVSALQLALDTFEYSRLNASFISI